MGLTQKLGTIPLAILTDSSNNVGIGAAANASYKLQVTGATNLTGALSGTSATFSSSVKVASSSTGGLFEMGSGANANSRSFRLASDVNDWGDFGIQVSNSQTGTTYTNALLINRSGTVLVNATSSTYGAASGYNLGVKGTSGQAFISIARTGQNLDSQGIILGLDTAAAQLTMIDNLPLTFGTNNAERMRIYPEGQIGIKGAATTEAAYALFTNDANTGFFNIFAGGSGTATKGLKFKVTTGSSTLDAMTITSGGIVQVGITTLPSGAIGTDNGCMFINNNLYIGNTNGTSGFAFRFDGFANGLYGLWSNASGVDQTGVVLNYGAGSWTSSSDERLKDINSNIENAIDKLKTLRTVNYSWKLDETKKENLGLIAQEVEKVFPQVVDILKDGYLGIRYTELIPVLIKAIQEQTQIIKDLEARIVSLESK